MKKIFLLASCAVLLLVSGCKKEDPVDPQNPEKNAAIAGNVAKPEWIVPSDSLRDPSLAMLAVVKIDLSVNYKSQLDTAHYQRSDQDMVAAFAGSECLGEGAWVDSLCYIYIDAPVQSSESNITIRYYSTALKNIFVARDAFVFASDGQQGSYEEPFVPNLLVERK